MTNARARDEFSEATKRALEGRVGSVCSKPGCGRVTRGPKVGADTESINFGEAGHITAAAEGGPRWNPNLSSEQRRSAANGIWLCLACHHRVDHDASPYDEATLEQWKREAEARAHAVVEAGRTRDAQPALISVLHRSMEFIADGALFRSVPPVFQSGGNQEVVIDACDLYTGTGLRDVREALRRQAAAKRQLDALRSRYPAAEVAYYGVAHVPLAMHFGFLASTKLAPQFAERDRTADTWHWLGVQPEEPPLQVVRPVGDWSGATDAVIRVAVSYPVLATQTDPVVRSVATFELNVANPAPDRLHTRAVVVAIARAFRGLLDDIRQAPRIERVHVFAAVPMAVAFALGQQVSSSVHPTVLAYNFRHKDRPQYAWGVQLANDPEAPDAVVAVSSPPQAAAPKGEQNTTDPE